MHIISALFCGGAVYFHITAKHHARDKSAGAAVTGSPARLLSILCGISGIGTLAFYLFGK